MTPDPKYFTRTQVSWINDDHPLKIMEKSRQVGATHATDYRTVISTHRGANTVFNQIIRDITQNGNPMGWRHYKLPIHKAVVTVRAIPWTWCGFGSVGHQPPIGPLARGNWAREAAGCTLDPVQRVT